MAVDGRCLRSPRGSQSDEATFRSCRPTIAEAQPPRIPPVTDDPWIDHEFEQSVRETAYFLWEQDGRPEGREQEYWFEALKRCLRERDADALLREPPRYEHE